MLDAQPIYCYEFVDVITDKPDISDPTTWDWTPAINAAIAKSKAMQYQPVCLPHHAFITSGGHILSTNILEYSGGSTTDGKNIKVCLLSDTAQRYQKPNLKQQLTLVVFL